MKSWVTLILIVILLAVCAFLVYTSIRADARLEAARVEYAVSLAAAEAAHAEQEARLLKAEETITQQNVKIGDLNAQIYVKTVQLNAQSAELAELQAQEPIVPELETHPLIINLRAQIRTLEKQAHFSLAIIDAQATALAAWEAKFDAQVSISESWKQRYETEHALRLEAERLFKLCEKSRRVTMGEKALWTAAGFGAGVLAGKVLR